MPASQPLAPAPSATALGATQASAPLTPANGALPINNSVPAPAQSQTPANANGFVHTIAGGESLYTIARRYEVTTQSIVQVNKLSSPDKITVGQKIIIPGRGDLVRTPQPASTAPAVQTANTAPIPQASPTQPTQSAPVQEARAPAAQQPAAEPVASGHDKFRWPASGRVIVDFAASRGTGINIDVPQGTTVKAAENGTVIYVGSGVEGYGNLVLIRHPNGYVSAYAHLQGMNVSKGAVVNRGDGIGTVGMTGSVSAPQLHFELRKGATPVDPVPLLAS